MRPESENCRSTALVLGASGMLGRGLCALLAAEGKANVVGTWRSQPFEMDGVESLPLDLSGIAVRALVLERQPETVYHLAWQTNLELCEADPAQAYGPVENGLWELVEALNQTGGKLVFVSTDSVFSDAAAERYEDSLPSPVNVYGRSKILAEGLIRSVSKDWVVARCCPLGIHPTGDRGLVSWMAGKIVAGESFGGWQDSIFTPLSVATLSRALCDCAKLHNRVVHLHSSPPISKYEFLRAVLAAATGSDALVKPGLMAEAGLTVRRPHDQSLQTRGDFPFANTTGLEAEIEIVAAELQAWLGADRATGAQP